MKIWLKYLIGIALGMVFSAVVPPQSEQSRAVLQFIMEIVVRFGRYTLIPLLFFSIATACFRLRNEKLMLRTGIWIFATIILSSALLTALGLLSALIIKLPRIPIMIEKVSEVPALDAQSLLTKLFPYTGFESLLHAQYLLPCFIFAGFAGAGAADDQVASKPAMNVFNSLSKVCYIVMSLFTELLAVGMIALTFGWMLTFNAVRSTGIYAPLLWLLLLDLAIVAFVLYPLLLRLIGHEQHPYRVLYASICPFLVAFFSGDTNLTLPLCIRHGKESLGIRRRVNAVTFPLFSIFARGGAALVASICFVLIFRSYSSLPVWTVSPNLPGKMPLVIWIAIMSFLLSFVLCDHATGGPFLLLTILCLMYGGGFEAGYLLLKDVAPIICAFAAGFDVLTAMFGSYLVGCRTRTVQHQELRKFI